MEVHDNFLLEDEFSSLKELLIGPWFPWFYNNYAVQMGDGHPKYKHEVYHAKSNPSSGYLSNFYPCLNKLGAKVLYRILVNSMPSSVECINTGYHTDGFPCNKTAILYINTNDGWTEFKNHGKVDCVANRMVVFDSTFEHAAVTSTNVDRRLVVNFNYET